MKFDNTQVMNFQGALRGMRNPKNSWAKSDSYFGIINIGYSEKDCDIVVDDWIHSKYKIPDGVPPEYMYKEEQEKISKWLIKNGILQYDNNEYPEIAEVAFIGPNDMKLAQRLIRAGSEHRKFMRQIFVSVDITAPIYWWKEMSTYKINTTANSTSTMHTLVSEPITFDKFETDDYTEIILNKYGYAAVDLTFHNHIINHINFLEMLREKFNETKDERYWKELIRWLPESWLQTRTWTCNYENLLSICRQRNNHKLNEWHSFINWAKTLPYAEELIFIK